MSTADRSHEARNPLAYDANTERTYINGRDISNCDVTTCDRCGVTRRTRTGRATTTCLDCKTVEHHANRPQPVESPVGRPWTGPAGIVVWATPMSDEDMAWCEKAAETHKRLQNERVNRRGWWQRYERNVA